MKSMIITRALLAANANALQIQLEQEADQAHEAYHIIPQDIVASWLAAIRKAQDENTQMVAERLAFHNAKDHLHTILDFEKRPLASINKLISMLKHPERFEEIRPIIDMFTNNTTNGK